VFLALFDVRKPYQGAKNVVFGGIWTSGIPRNLKNIQISSEKVIFFAIFS